MKYFEITFSSTQVIKARTMNAAVRKAKKKVKPLVGNTAWRMLINRVTAEEIINEFCKTQERGT